MTRVSPRPHHPERYRMCVLMSHHPARYRMCVTMSHHPERYSTCVPTSPPPQGVLGATVILQIKAMP